MAIKFIKQECPYCGAVVHILPDADHARCDYCGSTFSVDKDVFNVQIGDNTYNVSNQSTTNITNIDNKKSDKVAEYEYKSARSSRRAALIILACCFASCVYFTRPSKSTEEYEQIRNEAKESNMIMVEESSLHFETGTTQYKEAIATFQAWGFTNIKAEPLEDLNIVTGLLDDGKVEKIMINGIGKFSKGDCFPIDASVVIIYHSKPGE